MRLFATGYSIFGLNFAGSTRKCVDGQSGLRQPLSKLNGAICIMLSRILTFVYGAVSYALFVVTFLYAIGFIGNFAVPKSVDSILDGSWQAALLIDLGLLTVFALQHSVMARPGFQSGCCRVVTPPIKRK